MLKRAFACVVRALKASWVMARGSITSLDRLTPKVSVETEVKVVKVRVTFDWSRPVPPKSDQLKLD
ncbi:hypothetical protein VT84_33230 [Gemmata sp. SH-PL17]|uniref:hypothetical protein n=1 Tax=Gemmata sp. SH-PL17 TaxID=1630693 RepID=UPI00078B246A|nr:hypothetical protein [Gemmata sp. SH-PL17]AMV29306.1 hypothetical protein VT84_33230 [Gemmata sp. SH-PL17]